MGSRFFTVPNRSPAKLPRNLFLNNLKVRYVWFMIQGEIFQFPFGAYIEAPFTLLQLTAPFQKGKVIFQLPFFSGFFCCHVVNLIISVGFFLGTGSKSSSTSRWDEFMRQYEEWHIYTGCWQLKYCFISTPIIWGRFKAILTVRIFFEGTWNLEAPTTAISEVSYT